MPQGPQKTWRTEVSGLVCRLLVAVDVRTCSFLMVVVLALSSCSPKTTFLETNTPPRPMTPRHPSTVELFIASEPARDFVEVGMLSVREVATPATQQQLLDSLRARAARQGCDAVILGGADIARPGILVLLDSSMTDDGYYAACIVYLDSANKHEFTVAPREECASPLSAQTRP